MFRFLRDIGSSWTSGELTNKNLADSNQDGSMLKKNFKNSKTKKKDVMEELANLTTKYPYSRPTFLELKSQDELQMVLGHGERLITLPKRSFCLPRSAGYAECTNAGKSSFNEDQAVGVELSLGITASTLCHANSKEGSRDLEDLDKLTVFGVFDGHAGSDVAVTVSHELPHRLKERISDVITDLKSAYMNNVKEDLAPKTINVPLSPGPIKRRPTVDRLVVGALESAFHDMDFNLIEDESQYTVKGGCAALVILFYANKLYVANAGDCRAVMSLAGEVVPMSNDFTPESERRRLQSIAEQHPDLLGDEFCPLQFTQRLGRKDIGTQMLHRDSRMEGWANKTIAEEDLRFPLILGDGRRARLLATIGLTRGLGDHKLQVFDSCIKIKPFLSSTPEVKVHDFSASGALTPNDVIIIGSDGLWDVITNKEAVEMVLNVLTSLPVSDKTRYIAAAQVLIAHARGELKTGRKDIWVLKGTQNYASHDDITCLVIPLSAQPRRSAKSQTVCTDIDIGNGSERVNNSNQSSESESAKNVTTSLVNESAPAATADSAPTTTAESAPTATADSAPTTTSMDIRTDSTDNTDLTLPDTGNDDAEGFDKMQNHDKERNNALEH